MPKKLYGTAKSTGGLRKRAFQVADDQQSSGWLTLAPVLPGSKTEEIRDRKLQEALRAAIPTDALVDCGLLAATLIEYATERRADNEDSWQALVVEACEDAGVSLTCDEDDGGAPDVVVDLRKRGVLVPLPPPLPPPREGDPALAILEEDGEWHACTIAALDEAHAPIVGDSIGRPDDSNRRSTILVRFLQWPKLQPTKRSDVILLAALGDAGDDDADTADCEAPSLGRRYDAGSCELCTRDIPLTFHHLIPKSVHGKYVSRASLPSGLPADATPAKDFLSRYGIMVCSACHAVVHRLAPNAVLAERFNSLASLKEAPEVIRWCQYASQRS